MSFTPVNAAVWMEIPVSNLDKAITFYSKVLGHEMQIDNSGPNPIANFNTEGNKGVSGHLYPGKPAAAGTGPTIHMAVPDTLEDTAKRCFDAGGSVKSEPFAIPAIGRFQYVEDPDGNSIGFFEPEKG